MYLPRGQKTVWIGGAALGPCTPNPRGPLRVHMLEPRVLQERSLQEEHASLLPILVVATGQGGPCEQVSRVRRVILIGGYSPQGGQGKGTGL